MDQSKKCTFSVVVPVYNSERSLEELYQRLSATFEKMGASFEVIFVNDKSSDTSYAVLRKIHKRYPENTTIIDLLKNYGQHNAIMCGFNYSRGAYVITIDDDLQNPPEEIPALFKKLEEGYDVVFGIPEEKNHKAYKNLGSLMIRKLNRKIFHLKDKMSFSSYRIIRREVVDEAKSIKTPFPYISGMLLTITTSVTNHKVEHLARKYGRSNYNLAKLIHLSFNLLINYSSIPLRIVAVFGFTISIISLIIGLGYIFKQLFIGKAPEGWTTLIVFISFYNALFLVFFSILGEYISRLLKESSKISQFVVRTVHYRKGSSDPRQEVASSQINVIDE
ncbi:MAG: glycosyltransferase family 2 protein [Cytophagales bacterium]|nr:glycosyltransferase family 2 protein [Cytophagales bacterium]